MPGRPLNLLCFQLLTWNLLVVGESGGANLIPLKLGKKMEEVLLVLCMFFVVPS